MTIRKSKLRPLKRPSNIDAWSALAKRQAKAVQVTAVESAQSLMTVKGPTTAIDVFKSNAARVIGLTTKHLLEATELGVGQFNAGLTSLEKRHPLHGALAPVAKAAKSAATSIEHAVASVASHSEKKLPPR